MNHSEKGKEIIIEADFFVKLLAVLMFPFKFLHDLSFNIMSVSWNAFAIVDIYYVNLYYFMYIPNTVFLAL